IDAIDKDDNITMVSTQNVNEEMMFDVSNLVGEEVFVAEQGVPNSKKDDVVSTADAAQDKGKGKMVKPKPVKKFSKKDQIKLDEELAFKLQAEEEEEERLAREKDKPIAVRAKGSSKRAGEVLQQESIKKQKMDDVKETAKVDEDKETDELQSLMEVIPDEEEVAIDDIPLATKPLSIVDWKILKEGKTSYYQIIRADRNSKRYSAFIQMIKSFDREDLETLWKLVKDKRGSTRLEEGYGRVIWGNLKTKFEHHVEDTVRIVGIKRLLDDFEVTVAKLMLLVYKLLLLVFRVSVAGTKLQLLKDYNCSKIKTAEKG
ncbi:hypothetical protein Tco_1390737, partial [Tanacetum coccineum]